jgi:hypothetical protein
MRHKYRSKKVLEECCMYKYKSDYNVHEDLLDGVRNN